MSDLALRRQTILSMVDNSAGLHACHPWTGTMRSDGYGQVYYDGKMWKAHRIVFKIVNEDFDDLLEVMHSCDNPPCCNVLHLSQGTHAENMADMARRGRAATREKIVQNRHRHGYRKLTEDDVARILTMRADGYRLWQLAHLFLVREATISYIVNRKVWKHVQPG